MNIKEYDKKIELAFYESGGGIVKYYYDQAIRGTMTLEDKVNDLISDIQESPDEYPQMEGLIKPLNDIDRISFINTFIGEKTSSPELCGEVAGVLFRNGKLSETLEFLEINDMDEPRYWDT